MEQKKILIVDDDLVLLETLQEILMMHGYICHGCYETTHILDEVQRFDPDLVILDYMLPEWNGGELCGAIRGVDSFGEKPIIIISAYANILFSVAEYGCDAILEKPFTTDQLLDTIRNLLAEQPADTGLLRRLKVMIKGKMGR
jgi:two-component system response regulator VicR